LATAGINTLLASFDGSDDEGKIAQIEAYRGSEGGR